MKKIILASALALALSVTFVPISNAEMAKEGSGTGSEYYHGTFKAVAMPEKEKRVFSLVQRIRQNLSPPWMIFYILISTCHRR